MIYFKIASWSLYATLIGSLLYIMFTGYEPVEIQMAAGIVLFMIDLLMIALSYKYE